MVIKNQKIKASSKFLFYGLLLYTLIYYSQLGSRVPALGKIRIEFTVGVIILVFCIPQLIKKITHNEEEKSILYPIYFFFAAAVISIPTTVAGYHTINWLIYLFKSFAIFIMIYVGVNTEKELKVFIYLLLFNAGIIIIEAFLLSLSGTGLRYGESGILRLGADTGLFEHPNALGGFCAGILPLVYFLFWHEKSWMKKFILIAFGLITLKVIALTQSRSAFVGVMSFVFFIWVISKKKALVALVIFIALLAGWSSLDTTTKERYLTILDSDEIILGEKPRTEDGDIINGGSMASRYEIILDGLRLFLQRPITGFGIGGYQVARIERLGRWQVAHNAYVQCLAELGSVGFIAWMLILINTFRLFGKTRKIMVKRGKIDNANFIYQMTYAFQGYLVVHLTLSMFGHTPYQNYWWISAAISLILIQLLKQKEQVEE
jgi:putative inorganic carbon (hco3(-)) transporter